MLVVIETHLRSDHTATNFPDFLSLNRPLKCYGEDSVLLYYCDTLEAETVPNDVDHMLVVRTKHGNAKPSLFLAFLYIPPANCTI